MQSRDKYIGRAQNLDLYGVTIKSTRKNYLIDTADKEYIDMLSSASSLTLGYERKDLIKAYVDQCNKVPHTCTVYTFVPIVEEYAKRLLQTAKIPGAKLLFGAFGSDVIDGAMKCAQAYTKKKKFIAFEKAYHGGTFLSLASNGFKALKANLYLPEYFTHLPYPTKENSEKTLKSIEKILKKRDTAGLIMETVLGDGGLLSPDPIFYKKIKTLLHKYGAILIFDEIQTGVGRTGKFWGYENFGIKPDLFCTAKGLGGGYATISACIGRGEIIDALQNCQHAFTLSAHPGSCAVGLRVIEAIYEEKVLDNVKKINKILCAEFKKLEKSKYFDEVRGLGLMLGIALKSNDSIGPYIGKICLKNGVYIGYYGSKNNVLRIHPALNIDEKTAIEGARRVIASVLEFEKNEKKYLKSGKFLSFFTS
jgi:4-aminobutyrate aminotransferase-like enzyme